jgi:hypothetical protein
MLFYLIFILLSVEGSSSLLLMSIATISPNEIPVRHSERPDVGRAFIAFDITGWADVEKVCKKVLIYKEQRYVFSAWNSDRNECIFFRPLNESVAFARWQ